MKYLGIFLFLIFTLGSSSTWAQTNHARWISFSTVETEQKWYHTNLFDALRRVIKNQGDLVALANALKAGPRGSVKRDQILGSHRILNFQEFIMRIALQVDPLKEVWLEMEEKAHKEKARWPYVEILKHQYLEAKLAPAELVILYDYYLSISVPDTKRAPLSLFDKSRPLHRVEVRLARDIKSYTRWPITPRRQHGKNRPKVPLDVESWKTTFDLFKVFKMEHIFDELWSQWVNLEAGSSTTRHIVSFEDFFIFRCKEISETDPFRALGLLQAYLVNANSSQTIIAGKEFVKTKGLTALLIYMEQIRNREQAIRFFTGDWPEALLNENTDAPEGWAKIPVRIHDVLQNGPGNELYYKLPGCRGHLSKAKNIPKN